MNRPEQQLHIAVAAYLRLALKPPTIWTTIGHGGGGRVRGALLKAMGVMPGWPDILILWPNPQISLMYGPAVIGLELKAGKGAQSPAQRLVEHDFRQARSVYQVCRSVDEVEGFLRGVGIPLHASVGNTKAASDAVNGSGGSEQRERVAEPLHPSTLMERGEGK